MLKKWVVLIAIILSFSVNSETKLVSETERSETLLITSKINHQNYEIYIELPLGYANSKRSYPVAILQDVGVTLPSTKKSVREMSGKSIEHFIIVGMSYSKGIPPEISRTRDFTPTYAPDEKGAHSLEAQKYSGKADEYIQFLGMEVIPLLLEKYRIDNENKIFIGNSFGALLGVYTLLVNAELFDSYILSSPSLWYDKRAIFRLEEFYFKKNRSMNAKVLMYIGEKERNSKRGDMVQDLLNYEEILKLRNYSGLDVSAIVVGGATHSSSFSLLLPGALKKIIPKNKL